MARTDTHADAPKRRRWRTWIARGIGALFIVLVLAGIVLASLLLRSRARLDGEVRVAGIAQSVEISRDARGVPVIRGESLDDVAFAQGFVHAQERFFQMDLLRRHASGELAALLGPAGVAGDRRMRRFSFSTIADHVYAEAPPRHRRLLDHYAAGVNAGLADLAVRPPEYLLLRAMPEPWRPRDTVLVVLTMFDLLHINEPFERGVSAMRDALPDELVDFLTPDVSPFDAPVIAPGDDEDAATNPHIPIPGPEVVDLRVRDAQQPGGALRDAPQSGNVDVPGSNSWAVSGSRTAHGGAILANDPHLPLAVPNIWFRVQLEWQARRLVGVSLPGVPGVLIGSNGDVAWGLTNTQGDFEDFIAIVVNPDNSDQYLTANGAEPFRFVEHTIDVRGESPVTERVRMTRFGPVIGTDHRDRPLALMWTAMFADRINLQLFDVMLATSLAEALGAGRRWQGPSQNLVIAGASGAIGWTVTGFIPTRQGFDGSGTTVSTTPDFGWSGAIDEAARPMVVDPDSGMIVTANNRTLPLDRARAIGLHWADPIRAHRITNLLGDRDGLTEPDMLEVQLDTRSVMHDVYRDILLETIDEDEADPDRAALREQASEWDGNADADNSSYRAIRTFRRTLHRAMFDMLTASVREVDPDFTHRWLLAESTARTLIDAQPEHLLGPAYVSWAALFRAAAGEAATELSRDDASPGAPWGSFNRLRMHHPFADALPRWVADRLNMPADPQDGDRLTVRVATPGFGASMRMVVSPGREDEGLMHMPGGQSGHFLSPFYRSGHDDWLIGRPTPLLAGPPQHHLELHPLHAGP